MANQQVKVDLLFQANTTAAQSNIQQLSKLLYQISTNTTIGIDNGPLQHAVSSAQQLQTHLQNAVNVNTGKLDLTKLNASLKNAGTNLQTLTSNLQAAGPAGQQAFLKIATAVASAEAPMIRVNQRLKDFGITLVNTIKWQLASTAIHSVSGMLSSAVRHAENLNVALNDIRIVTGMSTIEMGNFAEKAALAAKELNTTTTEYAKAALIFYQQGLSGENVMERADTVVKLAQVTGQSMETVSSQMTAIWNNFYDEGSKSLEYYADVLTKLGAATAASTDEIAEGMEKFAAVGDTIGLSYEYAAASVATVVDKTRQSADVVGTSFKTIFARMQGLSLGETLEDGVDLNKYSEALNAVGIEVLDASGQLREMDDILDELGAKWEGFGEETQIALAQTVGGIRQYNQMVALMDNWDAVKQNIEVAANATGELAAQQDIWSESYTAASQKVKQAQNELYESFINDEAIVKLTDVFAQMISTFSTFIDSIGGAVPFVLMLIGLFSKSLFPMIQMGIRNVSNMFSVWTGKAAQEVKNMQNAVSESLTSMMNVGGMSESQKQQIALTLNLVKAKQELTAASKHMSVAQQEEAQMHMQTYEALITETQQVLAHKTALEQEIELLKQKMNTGSAKREIAKNSVTAAYRTETEGVDNINTDAVIEDATSTTIGNTKAEMAELNKNAEQRRLINEEINRTQQSINSYTSEYASLTNTSTKHAQEVLDKCNAQEKKLEELKQKARELGAEDEERKKHLEEVLKVQERILQASQGDIKDMVVGQASTSSFADNEYSRGGDVASMETAMTNDVMSQMGGSMDDMGNMVVDASLANLEKLFGVMGQYKQQLVELTALENDFKAAKNEVVTADAALVEAEQAVSNAEAEVAAVKKQMQSLSKAEKKDAKLMAKLTQEMVDAQKDLAKAEGKREKSLAKQEKAQKKYMKTISGSQDSILAMAEAVKMSDKDFEALKQDFKDLEAGGTKGQQALKNITTTLQNLKVATSDTDSSLDLLSQSMQETLLGAGINPQQLNALVTKLQELGIITPDIANKIRMVGNAGDEMNKKLAASQQHFMKVASGIATAAGQITMAIGAVRSMISAFDEGNTPLETFSSLMMGISMLLPIIVAASQAWTKSKLADTIVTAAQNKIDQIKARQEGEEIVRKGILAGKTWGQVAAEVALKIAQNPVVGAVILGLIAASVVAIGIMTAKTKDATEAQKEKNAADMEASKQATELASKWAEQQDAMDGLITKYKDLKAAGEDYQNTVDDIVAAVPDLINAYREAAKGLGIDISEGTNFAEAEQRMKNAAAAGDVEAVEAAQEEMDALISPEAAEKAQAGYTASVKQLGQKLTETQGSFNGNVYSVDVGGADALWGTKEEEIAWKHVREAMGTKKTTKGKRNFWGNYGGTLSMDMSTNDQFMTDYENLMKARTNMEKSMSSEDLKNSDTYREIKELLDNTKEEYDKAKEMQAEANKYGVYDAKANLEKQGLDITEIDSLEDYKKYKEALLNDENVKGDPEAEAIAKQWLEANANVQDYVKAEQKIGYIKDKTGQDLTKFYDALGEEEKKFFLEVDFNQYKTEQGIRAEIKRLQGIAATEEIEVKIKAISSAQSALKAEGMTEEDWTTLKDKTLNWGQDGIMEFTDFLKMSYADQQDYLKKMKETESAALVASTQNTINALQQELARVKSPEEYKKIQANIESLQGDLAIQEKMAEAAEIQALDLNVEEVEKYTDHIIKLADNSDMLNDSLAHNPDIAKDVAKATMRMNRGVESLSENFENWSDILKNSDKASQEYAEALSAMSDAVADIANIDAKWITDEFISDNLDLISEAAKGSAKAIDELRDALGLDIVMQIAIQNDKAQMTNEISQLHEWITQQIPNIKVGAELDKQKFVEEAQNLINAAGMTAEQANAYFKSIGFEPEFVMETQDVEHFIPEYTTETATYPAGDYTYTGPDGQEHTVPNYRQVSSTYQSGGKYMTEKMEVPALSSDGTPKIKSLKKVSSGAMNNFSSSNVGGPKAGGNKSQKAEKVKKSDVVERYKEINDQMEKLADTAKDTSKTMDRLYGASRLQAMQKQNDLVQDEIELLKQKKTEALAYLEEDRKAVDQMAKEAGVIITFDEQGLISNYDEAMTEIYNELDTAITQANKDGTVSEDEQEKIDLIQKRADNLQGAIDQYDETRTAIDDLDNQLDDKFYEWQDNNAEMLSYKLELSLELNEMDLEDIDYELSKIEDDFYSMAEAAALMSADNGNSQLSLYSAQLGEYANSIDALNAAYNETDPSQSQISQAAYVEGLKEARSGIMDNLQALQELDKSMMEYYGNTLDMAAEEIAKYTDRMDHQTAVLDHYSSLLEIMGKSNDYKSMGKVLEGKAKTLEDQAAVAKETMEMYKGQAADRLAEYQDALARGDKAAAELYLGQYEAALGKATEAEDAYLSKAEEWAEALKAVLENKLAEAGADLEKALTGGASFDTLTTQMERANSLQEEYLTTTNKIYETNKMINTAQQAIDKTTNTVAKQKLKSFQEETAQLQNKGKLSQYELEIQQAKYDLLLAEIALEEAQQAKSTVRLQRDSEGNFGYVYTADASQVSSAEQELMDAQNNLYNIGLEGANDYTQKYQETMQEMYDTLTEIQEQYLNGEFATEEEYHAAMEEAKAYYYQKLQDYSSLYQVALTTDSRVVADAWSTDFADMTYNTDSWMTAVDGYIDTVKLAFDDWASKIDIISTDTGTDLNSLADNVKEIVTESENLKNTLTGKDGVIAATNNVATAVAGVTSNYATLRSSMQETIAKYEELGKAASDSIKKQQQAIIESQNNATDHTENAGNVGGKGSAGSNGTRGGYGNEYDDIDNDEDDDDDNEITQSMTIPVHATTHRDASKGIVTIDENSKISLGSIKIAGTSYSAGGALRDNFYSLNLPGYGFYGYILESDYKALRNMFPTKFDTGGYTGSWGSEGKLAMLHEKELILNADDTTNFLASLEVLREIVNTINLHSMNAQLGGLLSTPRWVDADRSQLLEQQVHIEASFPNVQNRNEIEEAFNNLVNKASQYINRK